MNTNSQPIQEISPQKLFDVLQKEYLICILRSKIYPIKKHSEYWAKLAQQKKEKICHLKNRYTLVSIFDDQYILRMYERNVYNEYGMPNFYYPNDKLRDNQAYWDIKNYFSLGSKVKFINEKMQSTEGIIRGCSFEDKTVDIECGDSMYSLSMNDVSRML